MPNFITIDALFCRNQGLFNDQSDFNNNNNNNIAHFYRAPLCQSHRGASATAKVYNVTYTPRDRITPKLCTYRQWGNAVRGIQTCILQERHLTNEFLFKFSVVLSVTLYSGT